jgi:hypothetical protein
MGCVPGDIADAVYSSLPKEMQAELASAGTLGWISVATHVALCRGWHEALGDEGFRSLFRQAFLSAVDAPLLGAIVKGSLRVFGSTPSAAARAWAVGWPYIFRKAGRVEVLEASSTTAAIKVLDLPVELQDMSFALGVAGSFDGNAELVGKSGRAEYDTVNIAQGTIHLSLEWS